MFNSMINIPCSEKSILEAFDVIKDVLESAHQESVARAQTAEIRTALISNDYDCCFNTAQIYLKKYRKLINDYSFFTGISVIDITNAEARSKDIAYWKHVLEFAKMIIYANKAIDAGLKSVVEKEFRKTFQIGNKTNKGI